MVEAFSTRAQEARERLETPATPSSISSRETVEQSAVPTKPKLSISFSDKYIEESPESAKIEEEFDKTCSKYYFFSNFCNTDTCFEYLVRHILFKCL